jgi:uncharacterized membrane protein YfcA
MDSIILVFIGFATSFVGTLAGGGGLIGMPALLLTGVPIHQAIAAAKFSNMFSSFSSFFVLLRQGKINWKQTVLLIPLSLSGGITGGIIASSLSEKTMTYIAIFLLSFALSLQLLKKHKNHHSESMSLFPKKLYPLLYGIGIYDGMFGPGQATLLMYTYLRFGFEYLSAIAFTRFQTFLSCFGAFFTYLFAGHFNWKVAIFLAIGSLIGAQTSVRLANKLEKRHLQIILNTVTLLLIAQLVIKAAK